MICNTLRASGYRKRLYFSQHKFSELNHKDMRCVFIVLLVFFGLGPISAQHFLSVDGQNIVNEAGEPMLLRGMGLGGWMVQEGYMMQTSGFAGPQYEIRAMIEDLIGVENTDDWYEAWLQNL